MKAESNRFDLQLLRRAIFTVPDAAGVQVNCREGAVWITLDNDTRDIVLEAGQSFTGDSHRRALISAIQTSDISVSKPAAEPVARVAPARRAWLRRSPQQLALA